MIQHQLVWSYESLTPKLSKISPLAGLKRLFSKQALANFAKGIVKLVVVGTVLIVLMWPERDRLEGLMRTDPAALLPFTQEMALKLLGAVVALLGVVAAADYFFQYRQWFEKQKMSLQRTQGRVQAERRRSDRQGQIAAVAPAARAQAHDGGCAEGLGYHHQPDPLCHRTAI